MNFELHFRKIFAVVIQSLSCRMYASYGLVKLYVKTLDLTGFTLAICRQNHLNVVELSIKEK